MKHFILFALFLLAIACSTVKPILEGPSDLQLFSTPQGKEGHAPIIKAILEAEKNIFVTIYHLTDPEVVDALVVAKRKGLDVKVILDSESTTKKNMAYVFTKLLSFGIEVRKSSSAFSITHQKTLVIDENKAFILSMNIVKGHTTMRDFGLITSDKTIVDDMTQLFHEDWKNAELNSGNTPLMKSSLLLWSPKHSEGRLVDLIKSAQKEILFVVENFNNRAIEEALIAQAKKGVAIRAILPMCDLAPDPFMNYPTLERLKKQHIDVHVMPSPSTEKTPYMHAKMIVVDGTRFYVGSVNFTYNSTQKARELGIVASQAAIAALLKSLFEKDWSVSLLLPEERPACSEQH